MTTFPSAPSPPTTCVTRRKASVSPESQPSSSKAGTQLYFSEAGTQLPDFSQISAHDSGAWHHSHTPGHNSIWDFYFDITEWHILPALMLHLINPCTKRKVLSLTKPKGKIYKTKSLGHYITLAEHYKWVLSSKSVSYLSFCQSKAQWITIECSRKLFSYFEYHEEPIARH